MSRHQKLTVHISSPHHSLPPLLQFPSPTTFHDITLPQLQIIYVLFSSQVIPTSSQLDSATYKTVHLAQSPPSFLRTCPHHHGPSVCAIFTMSSIPICSPYTMEYNLSLSSTPHIHPIILTSAQCNTSPLRPYPSMQHTVLHTGVTNHSSQQQGNISSSENGVQ